MLVLTRKVGETVILEVNGKKCEVKFISSNGSSIRLGFQAGREFQITRKELEVKNGNIRTD